jgi:hypothetical protein
MNYQQLSDLAYSVLSIFLQSAASEGAKSLVDKTLAKEKKEKVLQVLPPTEVAHLIGAQLKWTQIGAAPSELDELAARLIKRLEDNPKLAFDLASAMNVSSIGDYNTITGNVQVPLRMGSGNTIAGPTDRFGNCKYGEGTSIGFGAGSAPQSVIIGAFAGANLKR